MNELRRSRIVAVLAKHDIPFPEVPEGDAVTDITAQLMRDPPNWYASVLTGEPLSQTRWLWWNARSKAWVPTLYGPC